MVPTAIAIEKPTYTVERGSVASHLFESGRVAPADPHQLSFPLDGNIDALQVSEGETVSAGDVVAVLDTTSLQRSLQAAEADLSLAREQLAIAQESKAADLRRAEIGVELVQLQLDFAVAQAGQTPTSEQILTIEELRLALELARLNLSEQDSAVDPSLAFQVAQSQLQLERIETQIAQSTLFAPITGTVLVVNFDEGDSVKAGQIALVIADLSQIEVQISLFDRELQILTEGMAAHGTVPSRPETSFPMTVRQLPYPYGTGAQEDEADSTVHISFDEPKQVADLGIGTRLEVAILLERKNDVLWLPPAAIREFNGRRFVVVQEGEAQKRLDVRIGLQNDYQVEIVSGVSEGQLVVGP
jgi:multidrug efflux pump subunit AcrA (membrane-fusion protein)